MIDSVAAPPSASVIIAAHTFQRCEGLTQAVASAMEQQPEPYEVVVVVDNNPDLYAWVRTQLPDVVAVDHRGPRGASATRNSGARVAQGEILAFLDDDAVARQGWLRNLIAPLARPDVVGVGGYVEPVWLGPIPHWMPAEFLWVVGASYRGMPATAGPIRNVWSENMAVTRADFLKIGGFREGFGKAGWNRAAGRTPTSVSGWLLHSGPAAGGLSPQLESGTAYRLTAVPYGSSWSAVITKVRPRRIWPPCLGHATVFRMSVGMPPGRCQRG